MIYIVIGILVGVFLIEFARLRNRIEAMEAQVAYLEECHSSGFVEDTQRLVDLQRASDWDDMGPDEYKRMMKDKMGDQ